MLELACHPEQAFLRSEEPVPSLPRESGRAARMAALSKRSAPKGRVFFATQ